MKKVLSVLLATVMLLSFMSFTVAAEGEQNFIDGGIGFIGSHIDVSANWDAWAAFPNMTFPLGSGQWDVYVDPAVWNAVVSGVLVIDYSDYADAIQFFAQVDMNAPGSIYSVIGPIHTAPGVVEMVINALDMNMVRNAGTGHLGWMRLSFNILSFERLQYHLLNSPNNLISIGIGFGNSAGVQAAGGHYDIGGSLVGAGAGENVNFWEHFDNAAPSTFAILDTITVGRNITVTFDADGGTPAPPAQTVIPSRRATEPADPYKSGYTFDGWYVRVGDNWVAFNFDAPILGFEDITVVARYTRDTNYVTLAYNLNGGTPAIDSEEFEDGETATITTVVPTRERAVFLGWARLSQFTDNVPPAPLTTVAQRDAITFVTGTILMDANITLVAVWAADTQSVFNPDYPEDYDPDQPDGTPDFDQARVTYMPNGATSGVVPAPGAFVFARGTNVTLFGNTGNLARTDAVFLGWSLSETALVTSQAEETAANIITSISNIQANATVHAVWAVSTIIDGVPDYRVVTVTFDATDSDDPSIVEVHVERGTSVARPSEDPEKDEYTFDGWGVDDGYGNIIEWNFNNPVNGDMTLVPIWSQDGIVILIPDDLGDGLGGFTILRGAWARETTATITFLVRINNSAAESVFLSRLDRMSFTAASSEGFEFRAGTATPDLILTHGSLVVTADNIGDVVEVDGVEYREVNLEVTNTLKSGIVDFTLTFTTADDSETLATAIHRVLIPGDVNKDAQVNSLDHATIFSIMRSETPMPGRMSAGDYVFELADINRDGQINSLDHAIVFNMMRGFVATN